MLGIVTPDHLVDVNAVKKKKVRFHKDCKYCGCSHDKEDCPAFGKTCNRCGRKNHFVKKCKQNDGNSKSCNRPGVRMTATKGVNLVAILRRLTQLKLTQIVKVAVLAIATVWRIWLIRSNLFSITKTMVDR